MESVKEQILSYPHLSPEKKREVEEYVETHPKWAPLLRDVRALESLGASTGEETAFQSLLKAYVVARHVETEGDRPPALRKTFTRVEQVLAENPDLQVRADAIRKRLKETEAEIDPVAHFESLTGHSLETEPSSSEQSSSSTDASTWLESSASLIRRLLRQIRALPLAVRGAGGALLGLLTIYATLFAVSKATQSPLKQLAAVDVSNQMVKSYYSTTTRGAATSSDTTGTLYLRALSTLRQARSSTLGLFPHYNTDSLQKAKRGLQRVLDRTPSGAFVALEAKFYLGKIHLAQGRVQAARTYFRGVIEGKGRRVKDARRILNALREMR